MTGFGYRPPQYRLLDSKLTLSPETQAFMNRIAAEMAAKAWMDKLMAPDFELSMPVFHEYLLQPPVTLTPPGMLWPAATPQSAPKPPNPGPSTPEPGEMKDVAKAIYKLPIVQSIVQRANDEAMKHLRALKVEWGAMPTGEKVIAVSTSVITAAAFITPILANKETRLLAFDFIKGKDIPVPGVTGLSFKILDHGGGASVPLYVPGLKFDGSLQVPPQGPVNFNAMVTWDVTEFWRSREKK